MVLPEYSPTLKSEWKKKTGIVETIISNILRNLPFSQNQPRKSADD